MRHSNQHKNLQLWRAPSCTIVHGRNEGVISLLMLRKFVELTLLLTAYELNK